MTAKRQNFVRLAERRTNKVLKAIDTLGHCSNKHLYEYGSEDINIIFQRIEEELEFIKTKFEREGKVFKFEGGEE